MWHPTEDELIQHLCGESDPRDRDRLQAHVAGCDECRRACEEITGALTMVDATVPEPPEGFERVMWARVQQAIAESPRTSLWTWRQWLPAGAVAAMAIVGVVMAGGSARPVAPADPAAPVSGEADERARERVLYTALDSHFQQAELLLIELRNASERDSLDYERFSADELVAAGRLYRLTAEYGGHANLARVLDELEPVLVEVARSSASMDPQNRQWLRSRIENDGLLFKVRAATNDIRERVEHGDQ